MTNSPTYFFAGGGTGGHLFPGIAVARELQRRDPNARILFVGSEKDLEQSILIRQGFEHCSLPVESLQTLKRRPFRFLIGNWRAWRDAKRLLQVERPAAVVGLGGYASAPIVWAAARAKVPTILLEQNVIPGRTTRWLARSANLICTSFPEAAKYLPDSGKVFVTGNPVRAEIAGIQPTSIPQTGSDRPTLLVLGGSQGADSLNDAVVSATGQLAAELHNWHITHQTGPRQTESVQRHYDHLSLKATVAPFFDDMSTCYRSASLVISRAGATTMAELACCGLPAILLPYPFAADNHQHANALSFQNRGAAVVVDHRATPAETAFSLAAELRRLLVDADLRNLLARAASELARPNAAASVVDQIELLIQH